MRVVAVNRLRQAQEKYPAAKKHLEGLCHILSQGDFYSEISLRDTFGDVRSFNHSYRFPIPETMLLVHAKINFEAQVALVELVLPGNH